MKLLIVLLTLFTIQTEAKSLESIEEMTYQNTFWKLSKRLAPGCEYSDDASDKEFYYRQVFSEGCTKPTISQYENELASLKAELTEIEEQRLAKRARQKAMKQEFKKLKDLTLAMSYCGYNIPNKQKFKEEVIKNEETVILDCLKSKDSEVKAAHDKQKNKKTAYLNACAWLKASSKPIQEKILLGRGCK